jgi:hypothetical protein
LVAAYGIASVFTPERFRRRGYAQHMMRLLHFVLANPAFREAHPFPAAWGAPPAVPVHVGDGAWSVLFSDVGSSFYERCGLSEAPGGGWKLDKPVGTIWKVPKDAVVRSAETDDWEPLSLEDAEHIWQEDAKWMAQDVEQRSASEPEKTFFTILPTSGMAAAQVQRVLNPSTGALPSGTWGARRRAPSGGRAIYATWSLDLRGSGPTSMVVTRLRVPDAAALEDLWQQLLHAAQAFRAEEIEIWNLPSDLVDVASRLGGHTAERDEHLPAVAMYSGNRGAVEWMFNEK